MSIRFLRPALLAVAALSFVTTSFAAPAKPAAKDETVYCTVMDMPFKKSKAFGKSTVGGKTYYFCCKFCKTTFDKDPAKNAKAADKKLAAWKKKSAAKKS